MKLSLISLALLLTWTLSGQTYIDIPWRAGTVTISGIEHTGMIRLGGDLGAPWLNHLKVYFVAQQDWIDGKPPKNKVITEYEPEAIDGYSTYTEDSEGTHFDMNFATGDIILVKGLGKKLTRVFLQLTEKGAVNVYYYVPKPDDGTSEEYQYAINHSTIYFKKGDGEILSSVECEMSDLLKECPAVVSKIKSGAYGFTDLSERTKKKGLGKIMADNAGDNTLENNLASAVSDYNHCVK